MAKNDLYFRGEDAAQAPPDSVRISFEEGSLVVEGFEPEGRPPLGAKWDERIERYRAPATHYRHLVSDIVRRGRPLVDAARAYNDLNWNLGRADREPYEHQQGAFDAWISAAKRGSVELPTGSGKSYVAELCIEATGRSTLVVVPTLDLVDQWSRQLADAFGTEVGIMGGGEHEVLDLTVSTYDSAAIHMDRLGGRFGLLVFDEVHHLPGDIYRQAAESCIAPFRLGLTATYERADGRHEDIDELIGPRIFIRTIKDLSGDVLADYDVETITVAMREEDAAFYASERAIYRGFVDSKGVRMGGRHGWRNFLGATSRSEEGRRALQAYHNQKRTALAHVAKIDRVAELLVEHAEDRVIVFTNDNDSVYRISERLLVPSITHQTPLKERGEILERFREGIYSAVVTSKVLNEGVDVPEANVAIVLSGTGSVREHVQRLGRILRRKEGRRARLYELVTEDSVETFVSERRREHDAYR